MRIDRAVGAAALLLTGVMIGRAQDEPPAATLSPIPDLERADGQLVGGLHLPSGGMVQSAIYLGNQLSLQLAAGDYLIFDPVGDDETVWVLKSGTIVEKDKVEGPKVFYWSAIEAQYVDRAEARQPRFVDLADGWRAAEYPLPDGRAVRIRILAR